MILLAIFLGSLGIADLVRSQTRGVRQLWLAVASGAIAFLLESLGSGLEWWWSPVAAAALIAWLFATREAGGRYHAAYWAVGGLAIVVLASVAWGPQLPLPAGPIVEWYHSLPYSALKPIGFTTFALTFGGALFLIETANVIVRLALRGERSARGSADACTPVAVARARRRSLWGSRATEPVRADAVPPLTELKGGRFIGPLERLFLLALILSGAFTALAALVAAKGIIRFPEISKDAVGGSKAEYFLVGSFASWALVLVTVLLTDLGPTQT